MRFITIFCILSVMLLCTNAFPVFAKAPLTAKIVFTSARGGNYEIYSMNPDGSEQINLTQHHAADLDAVWSPTGEKILFVSNRSRGIRDLYLMDPDGSNVRRVFKRKIVHWRTSPAWSPDGKQVAYQQLDMGGGGTSGMYILTLGEQEPEFIRACSFPAWSPDGTEIACGAANPGVSWIILMDVRTRKHERLLPKKAMLWQRQPSWAATGNKLAFSGNKHPIPAILDEDLHNVWVAKYAIFIVNRDGTDLQQLIDEVGPMVKSPELSPNGEEVLYTQEIKERNQIFKVNVRSGVRTQLTHVGMRRFGNSGGAWFDPSYALPVAPQPELLTTTWGEVKKR